METLKTTWAQLPSLLPPGEEGLLWIFGIWAVAGVALALLWWVLSLMDAREDGDLDRRRRR